MSLCVRSRHAATAPLLRAAWSAASCVALCVPCVAKLGRRRLVSCSVALNGPVQPRRPCGGGLCRARVWNNQKRMRQQKELIMREQQSARSSELPPDLVAYRDKLHTSAANYRLYRGRMVEQRKLARQRRRDRKQ